LILLDFPLAFLFSFGFTPALPDWDAMLFFSLFLRTFHPRQTTLVSTMLGALFFSPAAGPDSRPF
jgi:hypothetical protein